MPCQSRHPVDQCCAYIAVESLKSDEHLLFCILQSSDFQLAGAIARQSAGRDIGEVLGGPAAGIAVVPSLEDVLPVQPDVLIDYTEPDCPVGSAGVQDHGVHLQTQPSAETLAAGRRR
jgi:Dihydrodipicolinate reductase, N-terminus